MTYHAKPAVIRDRAALRARLDRWRSRGERIALVPTMGALHDGHMELVRDGKRRAERVVLTIFVNPTQFAPSEDFATYPRSLEADCALFDAAGGDLVYAPDLGSMYPDDFATTVSVTGPASVGLEDRFRPTHFAGVATIVAKLLIQTRPDLALFGDKDFQQLRVIQRMAADLDLPVAIVGVPTVREQDGLALSSRNAYLTEAERPLASLLHATLQHCARSIREGQPLASSLAAARAALQAAGFALDYCEARDSRTLLPLREDGRAGRLIVAARLGQTRLIDNVPIETVSRDG